MRIIYRQLPPKYSSPLRYQDIDHWVFKPPKISSTQTRTISSSKMLPPDSRKKAPPLPGYISQRICNNPGHGLGCQCCRARKISERRRWMIWRMNYGGRKRVVIGGRGRKENLLHLGGRLDDDIARACEFYD